MLTRTKATCPVYGIANELPPNQLPTIGDVMRFYALLKADLPKNIRSTDISSQVASKVAELWLRASIPTVTVVRVSQKIESHHRQLRNMMKKKGVSKETAISAAQVESLQLFNIAACSCNDFTICTCPKESKVPILEVEFLLDQRNARKMIIGGLDKEVTSKMEKKFERASKRQKYYESVISGKYHKNNSSSESDLEMAVSEQEKSADDSSSTSDSDSFGIRSERNMTKLPTVARECDRYGVSNTAGAAIATAALVDYGIITASNSTAVIDRCKLRRERERLRTNLFKACSRSMSASGPLSLYFDGRKAQTMCLSSVSSKASTVEEHITLLEEPNSVYLGHVTPESGSSSNILSAIKEFFNENNISLNNLQAVGCDGTNVNTGLHKGVIRQLELVVGHPLQWFVCLFHCNELPLRHLMMHLDGTTSGPEAFTGNIGRALKNCNELPVVSFEARPNNLPDKLKAAEIIDISKDQKYLHDFCRAIEAGHVTQQLANREPGPIVHSRWLTTANRILRLYVSAASPSAELLLLTDYILKVYAPVWFSVKLEPQCYKGAKHLWLMGKLSRFLPPEARLVVDNCIQRNGFYGHPENVLLSMLADDRPEIRELSVRRIKKARQTNSTSTNIRKFTLPKLNLDADDYHSLLNWQEFPVTEPPMLMSKSDDDIEKAIESRQTWILDEFPCHSQAVERHIRIVSEAAASVCGELRRDGYIRAKLLSRTDIPQFGSKKDWKCN